MLIVPVLQQRNQSPWGDPPVLLVGTEATIPLFLCCTAHSTAKMSALFPDSHLELGGLVGAHCVVSVQSGRAPWLP